MFRLKSHAATFALVIGLLTTFNQTARAESWSWESILSVFSSENAVAVCTTNPVVVNNGDSGTGSLRQAVIDACPGGTITFDVTGTIPLSTGQIVIDKNLTIQGPGANLLTVQNTIVSRVFLVNSGVTATLAGLTVTGGTADFGGGIYGDSSNINLTNVTVYDNRAVTNGGGIYTVGGTLNITGGSVTNNAATTYAAGGGIRTLDTTLIVTNASITNNFAISTGRYDLRDRDGAGGGMLISGGSSTITNSTISRNFGESGGGIFFESGTHSITGTTLSDNEATRSVRRGGVGGGGLSNERGTVNLKLNRFGQPVGVRVRRRRDYHIQRRHNQFTQRHHC